LGGATFLVAAAIEVFAVIAALDYWTKRRARYSGPTVLFGALIALVVNASLLYLQVSGHVFAHWFWLWIVLTAWSLWALVILLRDRAWSGLNYPVRISILAIVSGVLAVANVAYSQVYVPYSALPLVESAAEFKGSTLNGKGTKMYLPVHFSVKNAGGVSVYILGSIYWIRGGPAKDPDCLQRATSSADCEVIKSDYLIPPPGQELVPGEELSEDAVVKIDHPEKFTYEVVTAQTEVYLARTDRMTIDRGFENYKNSQQLKKEGKDKDPEGPPNVDYLRYQANISNGNEILNATRGHPRVTLWWANSVPRPFIYVDVGPPGHRNGYNPDRANGNPEVVGRYGFKVLRSSTVRAPFVELLDTAQDDLNAK
ncbi:hypothetical protein, partial [Leifsonia sp. NPDC058248]|uniref:hypothetical protein n=1 Tax=Leifsonia sp. NPDC058248 TaxID=3346402 RepID=UPI0036DC02EE